MELRYRTKALDPPKQRDDGEKDTPAGKKSKERFNKLRALAKEKKKAKEDNGGKKGKGMRKCVKSLVMFNYFIYYII